MQIYKYGRLDFIDTDWKPAVENGREHLMSNIRADTQELLAYQARFLAVQKEMKAKAELIGNMLSPLIAPIFGTVTSVYGFLLDPS